MKLSGSYKLNVKKEDVWVALNDPDILKQCIPGCESFDKESDTVFNVTATKMEIIHPQIKSKRRVSSHNLFKKNIVSNVNRQSTFDLMNKENPISTKIRNSTRT